MTRAVVLARGRGTRMQRPDVSARLSAAQRRYAESGLKAMMPIAGRPFLDYVLSALADAGITDVCLVIGPEHDAIRDYYTTAARPRRIRIEYAVQQGPRGTADALLAAASIVGRDDFLALNADNYYAVDVYRALMALDGPGLPAFSRQGLLRGSNFGPDRLRSFGLLRVAPNGDLEDIVEKPDEEIFRTLVDADAPVSMNLWRFDDAIFRACREVPLSIRGEYELPGAVSYAVRTLGQRLRTVPVHSGVLDLSSQSDVEEVEGRLGAMEPRP